MNSKFQILLTTAALAIVGVSIASLYGDDGATSAATTSPADLTTAPALPAVEVPAVPAAKISAPQMAPAKPIPSKQRQSALADPDLVKEKNPPVQVKIYELKFADAEALAHVLEASLEQGRGTIEIVPDRRTNQLIASGGARGFGRCRSADDETRCGGAETALSRMIPPAENRCPGANYSRPGAMMPAPASVPGQPRMPPGALGIILRRRWRIRRRRQVRRRWRIWCVWR